MLSSSLPLPANHRGPEEPEERLLVLEAETFATCRRIGKARLRLNIESQQESPFLTRRKLLSRTHSTYQDQESINSPYFYISFFINEKLTG